MATRSGWGHVFAGSSFAITILVGVFLGLWADRKFNSDPWGVLAGSLVGIVAGFYNLIKEFKDDSSH